MPVEVLYTLLIELINKFILIFGVCLNVGVRELLDIVPLNKMYL